MNSISFKIKRSDMHLIIYPHLAMLMIFTFVITVTKIRRAIPISDTLKMEHINYRQVSLMTLKKHIVIWLEPKTS